jgi:hypothetical protein
MFPSVPACDTSGYFGPERFADKRNNFIDRVGLNVFQPPNQRVEDVANILSRKITAQRIQAVNICIKCAFSRRLRVINQIVDAPELTLRRLFLLTPDLKTIDEGVTPFIRLIGAD